MSKGRNSHIGSLMKGMLNKKGNFDTYVSTVNQNFAVLKEPERVMFFSCLLNVYRKSAIPTTAEGKAKAEEFLKKSQEYYDTHKADAVGTQNRKYQQNVATFQAFMKRCFGETWTGEMSWSILDTAFKDYFEELWYTILDNVLFSSPAALNSRALFTHCDFDEAVGFYRILLDAGVILVDFFKPEINGKGRNATCVLHNKIAIPQTTRDMILSMPMTAVDLEGALSDFKSIDWEAAIKDGTKEAEELSFFITVFAHLARVLDFKSLAYNRQVRTAEGKDKNGYYGQICLLAHTVVQVHNAIMPVKLDSFSEMDLFDLKAETAYLQSYVPAHQNLNFVFKTIRNVIFSGDAVIKESNPVKEKFKAQITDAKAVRSLKEIALSKKGDTSKADAGDELSTVIVSKIVADEIKQKAPEKPASPVNKAPAKKATSFELFAKAKAAKEAGGSSSGTVPKN